MLIPLYLAGAGMRTSGTITAAGLLGLSLVLLGWAGNNSGGDQSRKQLNDAYAQLAAKNDQVN